MDKKKPLKCCGLFMVILFGTIFAGVLFTNIEQSMNSVEEKDGFVVFFHPKRYYEPIEWYEDLFNEYPNTIIGLEVFNKGDLGFTDRDLWDGINKRRSPEDLVWGFSNDDFHRASQAFRNYQHMLMPELTENALRDAMKNGTFYFSREPDGANTTSQYYGIAMAPKLTSVLLNGWVITIEGSCFDSIEWFDHNSEVIHDGLSIDVTGIESNFVRAVFYNEFGQTYTQPFGITQEKVLNPYDSVNWLTINHFKANFHTHTTESDGDETPKEVIERYHGANYKILAIADHNKNTWSWSKWIDAEPETPSRHAEYYPDLDMLAVSAIEASASHHFGAFFTDFSGWGIDLKFTFRDLWAQLAD